MKLILFFLALNFVLGSSQLSKVDSVLERIEQSVSILNLRLARIEARQTRNMIIYSRLEDKIQDVRNDVDSKHGETMLLLRNTVNLLSDLKMRKERSEIVQSIMSERIQQLINTTEMCCRDDKIVVACPNKTTVPSSKLMTSRSQSTTVAPATPTPTRTTQGKISTTKTSKTTPTSTNTTPGKISTTTPTSTSTDERKISTTTARTSTFLLTNTTSTSTQKTTSTSAIRVSKCDFEQGTCGFIQDNTDDFDWTRKSGGTRTAGTGPTTDHTYGTAAGYYMYIEASGRNNGDTARLISRQHASAPTGHCLSFYYHTYGSQIGALNVYKLDQQGQRVRLFSRSGNQGNQWILAQVTVTSSTVWDLVFEGIRSNGYSGDIAIDDINIYSKPCPVTGSS